jgi:titin
MDANNTAGMDLISFRIPGTKPYTITPLSPLPSITDPVTIDGTTQTNFTGPPIIQLNGASAGPNANGLLILGGNSAVRGLVINRFQRSGIRIEGLGTNVIQGNYLGTDVDGTNYAGNGEGGVYIYQSPGNLIGGTNAAARNILSGSNLAGIFIENTSATGNKVQGNYIGTDITGAKRLGNKNNGIVIASAPANVVGGTTAVERNIISANNQSGIYLLSSAASANRIQGNYIGTDLTGTAALSNALDGVTLYGANNNIIGGTNAGARNIISGNGQHGVFITNGAGLFTTNAAIGNQIQGNYIGTSASGSGSLGNQFDGVRMLGGSSNLIGGTGASARNVIAANKQSGFSLSGSDATANVVQGNFIGTDATGASALGNAFNGVVIYDFASNNIVGGTVAGAGNLISANLQSGVFIYGNSVRSNAIQGNLIGTDVSGHFDLGNALSGVRVESPANTIGGASTAARNVISGNNQNGVYLYLAAASNNVIQGNFIGTDLTGTTALPNGFSGIGITTAPNNTIGGTVVGMGNLISGNSNMAVYLEGGASGNVFQGNFIGTDVTGASALANGSALPVVDIAGGIDISASPSNLIGGTLPGAGNLISANWRDAIAIGDAGATGNIIQGNLIGTKADGVSALGNEWNGVHIRSTGGAANTRIGGVEPGAGNVLAYATLSQRSGVRIFDGPGNTGILVRGNSIFFNGGSSATGYGIYLGVWGTDNNLNCNLLPQSLKNPANLRQNFPVLTNAQAVGTSTTVRGTLNSAANKTFLLQFYATAVPEPSGNIEGKAYLGDAFVTTDGTCNGAFTAVLTNAVTAGQWITATATDPANNTSRFSAAVLATAPITITAQPVSRTNTAGTTANFSVTATGTPPLSCQWKKNGANLSNGSNVSGATTTNLTLTRVSQSDVANYSVVITNTSGSVTSSNATLTVIPPPALAINKSGNSISLSWPAASQGFVAQQAASLTPPVSWTAVTNAPSLVGDRYTLTITPGNGTVFYRLIFQ